MNWTYFTPIFESEVILNDLDSAWAGHKYFVYDLISYLKPKKIVELGTYRGTSFFSFCQAVKDNNLNCELFAVDTWKGDLHASFYGENVFSEVETLKDSFYKNLKIYLERMTFDEANMLFTDHSIDILHIDGYHTYEAVRHDFELWINKVKSNGVILFHDISEFRDDFGVYKLWEEIKIKYKTIEFSHSHGLGVLFVNSETHIKIQQFQEIWQNYYSIVPENKLIKSTLSQKEFALNQSNEELKKTNEIVIDKNKELDQKVEELNQKNEELDQKNEQLKQKSEEIKQKAEELDQKNEELNQKNGELDQKNKQLKQKSEEIKQKAKELDQKNKELNQKNGELVQKNKQLKQKSEEINQKNEELIQKNVELDQKNEQLNQILSSKTWRLTKAIRVIFDTIRHLISSNAKTLKYSNYIKSKSKKEGVNFQKKSAENLNESYYLTQNQDVVKAGEKCNEHTKTSCETDSRMQKPVIGKKSVIIIFRKIISSLEVGYGLLSRTVKKAPHFSPPTDDYCLVVPFSYNLENIYPSPKIAVVCHMYYTELVEEFKGYFLNIPYPFDLFITTDTIYKKQEIESAFLSWTPGKVDIRLTSNRGRDIAPKLITCRNVYDSYEFFLHVHTKKSLQEESLTNWRTYLLESLLGSKEIVKSIFEAFNCNHKLGMIAPQHYAQTSHAIGWGWNFKKAKSFAKRMGIKIWLKGRIDFPSGSMFWARSDAIKPLLNSGLTISEFPIEAGQLDNTISHVIERLFFFSCEKSGLKWIKIINPSIYLNPRRCVHINSQSELIYSINQIQTPLLNSEQKGFNKLMLIIPILKNIVKSLGKRKFYRKLKELFFNKIVKYLNSNFFYRKLYNNSGYKFVSFDEFKKQHKLHIENKNSKIDFDEEFYLRANKDVAEMVSLGVFDCGFTHYCLVGKDENRLWSNRMIKHKFFMSPNYPEGMFTPEKIKTLPSYDPLFVHLPRSKKPFLLILFSHLQGDLFYAGYTEFFRDFLPVFKEFSRIVLSVESEIIESKLATQFFKKIEVINQKNLAHLEFKPDIIICFNHQLFMKAWQLLNDLKHIVYYCQEYEAGFFPYGTEFIEAEKAIAYSKNIILSTVLLKKFLQGRNLITDQHIYTTRPKIECFNVTSEKRKRLFFYFRPEFFHTRNIPEILWGVLGEFCRKHFGYEIFMVGTIDTRFSFEINNTPVYVINKLPKNEYVNLISSCDVVIAMIYSAHPGVIAFQAAASGIPTVTNVFENRNASLYKQISNNIVPYDPIRDSLLAKIEEALTMPKGIRSFNEILYSGESELISLSEFINDIRERLT